MADYAMIRAAAEQHRWTARRVPAIAPRVTGSWALSVHGDMGGGGYAEIPADATADQVAEIVAAAAKADADRLKATRQRRRYIPG